MIEAGGKAFRIADVELRSRVIPAPMCNVSDRAFRSLSRQMGADLVTTQMIAAEGLIRDDAKTWRLLDLGNNETPVSVQLLGSKPESLARAAQILQEKGATIIDFNMGCPARQVTGNDCGSALMKDPELVREIIKSVRAVITLPFTVKMRAGWDGSDISAVELAKMCEAEGADAITLHARTREQGYKGQADWTLIARMKQELTVPVIGNGDVISPAHAVRMFRETGCDAIMIGRGLIGNPWLLQACEKAVQDLFEGRIKHESEVPDDMLVTRDEEDLPALKVPYYMKDVTLDERLDLILTHTHMMIELKGEKRGVLEMRKHSQNYIKGTPGCKTLRDNLMRIETFADLQDLLEQYRGYLENRKVEMDERRRQTE